MTNIQARFTIAVMVSCVICAVVIAPTVFVTKSTFAATQSSGFKHEVGLGGQTITNPTTATFLTVPAGAQHAWIYVKGNPVCWSDNADAPTSASPGEWPAGFVARIENDPLWLKSLRVINCAEGATTVKVKYSRDRRFNDTP
jgi:hypothetical protein